MTAAGKFLVLILLLGAAFRGAGADVVQFGAIRLRVSLENSPSVVRTAGGGGIYSSGGAVLTNSRWLAVMVTYIPGVTTQKNYLASLKSGGNTRGLQAARGMWIDDVRMRVLVAYPAANPRRSDVVYGLFEGTTHFWSVRLDGRRHTAQMFVPPQLLDRYAATTAAGRREIALAAADFRVFVEFTTSDGKLLGRVCSQSVARKGRDPFSFFTDLLNSPSVTPVKGAVIPRNKSPWAWYLPGTFDYIKDPPAGSGGTTPVNE